LKDFNTYISGIILPYPPLPGLEVTGLEVGGRERREKEGFEYHMRYELKT